MAPSVKIWGVLESFDQDNQESMIKDSNKDFSVIITMEASPR